MFKTWKKYIFASLAAFALVAGMGSPASATTYPLSTYSYNLCTQGWLGFQTQESTYHPNASYRYLDYIQVATCSGYQQITYLRTDTYVNSSIYASQGTAAYNQAARVYLAHQSGGWANAVNVWTRSTVTRVDGKHCVFDSKPGTSPTSEPIFYNCAFA